MAGDRQHLEDRFFEKKSCRNHFDFFCQCKGTREGKTQIKTMHRCTNNANTNGNTSHAKMLRSQDFGQVSQNGTSALKVLIGTRGANDSRCFYNHKMCIFGTDPFCCCEGVWAAVG